MGKKSRLKKEKQLKAPTIQKPPAMDPVLMKAYMSGRSQGIIEGNMEGMAAVFVLFNTWIEEIDQHIKGIGPKTKIEIEKYLADCIKKAVENKRIEGARIINDLPAASNE